MPGCFNTDLNIGIPTQKMVRRERPLGLCTSALSSGSGRVAKGEQRASSLTTSENPIWHLEKVEIAISSEHLVRALSVCNLCWFRNQRNSSSEAVCIFWQLHSNQLGCFGRKRISIGKMVVTFIILNAIRLLKIYYLKTKSWNLQLTCYFCFNIWMWRT